MVGAAYFCSLSIALPIVLADVVDSYLSFRIHQVASSQAGTAQIVELVVVGGWNSQNRFTGDGEIGLAVTNCFDFIKSFVFPSDLTSVGVVEYYNASLDR